MELKPVRCSLCTEPRPPCATLALGKFGSQQFLAGLREKLAGDARERHGVRRLKQAGLGPGDAVRAVEWVPGGRWETFRDRHGDGGRDMVFYLGRQVWRPKPHA